jgi:CRISPR system subtype II-B RNA-guided endonuclease Cas9/Csx12
MGMPHVYTCSVGLDLGAKNTGVFVVARGENEPIDAKHCKALTIMSTENFTYDMRHRTAVRHRIRSGKRSKLARRLIRLALKQQLDKAKIVVTPKVFENILEAVFSLMKRRGYSRIESEVDLSVLDSLKPKVFAAYQGLSDYFSVDGFLPAIWDGIKQDVDVLMEAQKVLPTQEDFEAYLREQWFGESDEDAVKKYKKGLSAMAEDAKAVLSFSTTGHLPRAKYLEAIKDDIRRDSRLNSAVQVFGGAERFWSFIGNIVNLQLRALRWYFNNPEFEKGDLWDEKDLKKSIVRGFKYLHPATDKKQQYADLIRTLENATDIVDCLCTLDPIRTIPPYEDQNNRRPPEDQTLLLNPYSLNRRFPGKWLPWVGKFVRQNPDIGEGLEDIVKQIDRTSRRAVNGVVPLEEMYYLAAYTLQRILDRTKELDEYGLRHLVKVLERGRKLTDGRLSQRTRKSVALLTSVVGSQNVEDFVRFASDYYKEVETAKCGMWFEQGDSLLERSGLHPPAKKKILSTLVANILQVSKETAERFIEQIWNKDVEGKTVAWYCEKIEETRKEKGNGFQRSYSRTLAELALKPVKTKRNKEGNLVFGKDPFIRVKQRVDLVADFIGSELDLNEGHVEKFRNPFSLAQLYTLIETERNGFSKTCLAVHAENAWRMNITEINGERYAQCSRLPADSVRPFDGVVRRVLDRHAWELTKVLRDEIQSKVDFRGGEIRVPFLVERNSFEFSISVNELKKRDAKKFERAKDASEKAEDKQWADKDSRIKQASQGICPYTGAVLGDDGEIDHIISRSESLKAFKTVFNSEANLIYATKIGNQTKGGQRYTLANLNSDYLKKIFGTDNRNEVQNKIETEVKALIEDGKLKYFDLLTPWQQTCVRHALFLTPTPDADVNIQECIVDALNNKIKTIVNGTQAWFVRQVMTKLQCELAGWLSERGNSLTFKAWACDTGSIRKLRLAIAKEFPQFLKTDFQSAASHTMDAMCAYACLSDVELARDFMCGDASLASIKFAAKVKALHPETCQIIRVERKAADEKKDFASCAIFKEGILGENFLPLIAKDGNVYIGFDGNRLKSKEAEADIANRVQVTLKKGRNPELLLMALEPFFNKPVEADLQKKTTYLIEKRKALEFLYDKEAKPNAEREALKQVLFGLLYYTVRKDVIGSLSPAKGKEFAKKEDLLAAGNFEITVKFKFLDTNISGKIELPAKRDWQKLLNAPEIKARLGQPKDDYDFLPYIAALRGVRRSSSLEHKRCRRVFSLPVLAAASGMVHIRRTSILGKSVGQAYSTNTIYAGFQKTNGLVDWNKPVPLGIFDRKNLGLEAEFADDPNNVVPMSHWMQVLDGDIKIWICPGTKLRRYVRVNLPWKDFAEWIGADAMGYKVPTDLPGDVAVKGFTDKVPPDILSMIGMPRSSIAVEFAGERIQFCFEDGTKKKPKL